MPVLPVTVGIPYHGSTKLSDLQDAVKSIQTQQIPVHKIHLVQDGDVDQELEAYVDKLAEEFDNIKISKLKKSGLPAMLNHSIMDCETPYYARMDSDDISFPQRMQKQVEYLEQHPEISILGAWAKEFSSEGGIENSFIKRTPIEPKLMIEWVHFRNPFIHSTILFRLDVFKQIGMYNPAYKTDQDLELWGRAINASVGIANLPEPLIYFRTDNMLLKRSKLDAVFRQIKARYAVRTWSLRLNLFKVLALLFRLTPKIVRKAGYKYLR